MNDLERTQNFLQKAKEKFPQFDYSLVTSIKNMEVTKVSVICPEHGEFITTPKALLKGKYGCPKCANKLKFKKTDKNTLCTSELPKDLIGIENPIVCDKTKIVGTIYCFINTINNKLYIGDIIVAPNGKIFYDWDFSVDTETDVYNSFIDSLKTNSIV